MRLVLFFFFSITLLLVTNSFAADGKLKVMAYNVLHYGDGCQGPTQNYHKYLSTVLKYADADIVSLEKAASIKLSDTDKYGVAPVGFADSILKYAFDVAYPGRYAYATITNAARANNICLVFYDKGKLGYNGLVATYSNITDFNLHRFFLKNNNLDTTFLFVLPNHNRSGDEYESVREHQMNGVLSMLHAHFKTLPNVLCLGDFNARSSKEGFYKLLTKAKDSAFLFFDPPFYPDKKLKYPAEWDHEGMYSAYFTTSTRESAAVPNACGTGGGAKNWYDHIFISKSIAEGACGLQYVANSYRTIGNDGQRFRVSILNSNMNKNASAPDEVLHSLYQMSNKYPVYLELEIKSKSDKCEVSIEPLVTKQYKEQISVAVIKGNNIELSFTENMLGQDLKIVIYNDQNEKVIKRSFTLNKDTKVVHTGLSKGAYRVVLETKHTIVAEEKIVLQ